MKWVFALLAVAFGIGFVVFGVGSGGTGVGDVLKDLFGGGSQVENASVQDAKDGVAANPDDPDALLALASAYRESQQPGLQAQALEKLVALQPTNADAYSQLGRAWFLAADNAVQEASSSPNLERVPLTSDLCTFPGTSGIIGAICEDPIDQSLSATQNRQIQDLIQRSNELYAKAATAFEELSKLRPDEPSSWLFLANAQSQAGNQDAQLAAYEEFLKRFPDDPNAEQIKTIVDQLKSSNDSLVG